MTRKGTMYCISWCPSLGIYFVTVLNFVCIYCAPSKFFKKGFKTIAERLRKSRGRFLKYMNAWHHCPGKKIQKNKNKHVICIYGSHFIREKMIMVKCNHFCFTVCHLLRL